MPANHFVRKGRVGCLLLHGFTASPNEFLEIGQRLTERGLTISIPTLPGHATDAADLLDCAWRDWFDCAKGAYNELEACCDEIFVCGLSMGAVLALHVAAHFPVKGVISLACPIYFPKWKKRVVRWLAHSKTFRRKRGGEDVRDLTMRPKLGSYRKFPYSSVRELFALVDHVRQDLPEVVQPLLVMHSRQDHTAPFASARIICDSVSSGKKRLVELNESYHIITVDYEKEKVLEEILDFIARESTLAETNMTGVDDSRI